MVPDSKGWRAGRPGARGGSLSGPFPSPTPCLPGPHAAAESRDGSAREPVSLRVSPARRIWSKLVATRRLRRPPERRAEAASGSLRAAGETAGARSIPRPTQGHRGAGGVVTLASRAARGAQGGAEGRAAPCAPRAASSAPRRRFPGCSPASGSRARARCGCRWVSRRVSPCAPPRAPPARKLRAALVSSGPAAPRGARSLGGRAGPVASAPSSPPASAPFSVSAEPGGERGGHGAPHPRPRPRCPPGSLTAWGKVCFKLVFKLKAPSLGLPNRRRERRGKLRAGASD